MALEKELHLLNSNKALEYLLEKERPDFEDAIRQIRFEEQLKKLQIELIRLQNWVVDQQKRVLILVEGREFAGKGDAIRRFIEHLNPRTMRLVALSKPTIRQQDQWYFKRYIEQLPERGEIVFFDRSWYNRAMVEPVNGFCTQKEYNRFMSEVNFFEHMLVNDGLKLLKIYFSISREEQKRRIDHVQKNPLRRWELSSVDLRAVELWEKYTEYKERMFRVSNTDFAPWHIIEADDKRVAQLTAISLILEKLPFSAEAY